MWYGDCKWCIFGPRLCMYVLGYKEFIWLLDVKGFIRKRSAPSGEFVNYLLLVLERNKVCFVFYLRFIQFIYQIHTNSQRKPLEKVVPRPYKEHGRGIDDFHCIFGNFRTVWNICRSCKRSYASQINLITVCGVSRYSSWNNLVKKTRWHRSRFRGISI